MTGGGIRTHNRHVLFGLPHRSGGSGSREPSWPSYALRDLLPPFVGNGNLHGFGEAEDDVGKSVNL